MNSIQKTNFISSFLLIDCAGSALMAAAMSINAAVGAIFGAACGLGKRIGASMCASLLDASNPKASTATKILAWALPTIIGYGCGYTAAFSAGVQLSFWNIVLLGSIGPLITGLPIFLIDVAKESGLVIRQA